MFRIAAAYLCIRVIRVGCDASNRADASAAAAPCAKAMVERGLWVAWPLAELLPPPLADLLLAEGLKWAASARIILITDFRLPSTMSVEKKEHMERMEQLLPTYREEREVTQVTQRFTP